MFLITNFKTYKNSMGKNGLDLIEIHKRIIEKTKKDIRVGINPLDLRLFADKNVPFYSQGADIGDYGSFTGKII